MLYTIALILLILWILGFFVGGVDSAMGGRRRWYGRW